MRLLKNSKRQKLQYDRVWNSVSAVEAVLRDCGTRRECVKALHVLLDGDYRNLRTSASIHSSRSDYLRGYLPPAWTSEGTLGRFVQKMMCVAAAGGEREGQRQAEAAAVALRVVWRSRERSRAVLDRKHVLAVMMQARVMTAAEPAHLQRFVVMVMVRINRAHQTADFADLLCKVASLDGSLHGEMCVVLRWIGSKPVRLSVFSIAGSRLVRSTMAIGRIHAAYTLNWL